LLAISLWSWSASAAIDPYVKNVLTTNSVTLGTNLTLVSGVLEASGGSTGGDTIWTNTPAGSVQLIAPTNYLALGISADTWFGTSTNNLLVGVHDVTAGDPPVAIFNIAAVDDAASVTNYADIYFRGDAANGAANFSIDSFNGSTSTILNLSMTPDDIIAALYAGGTARTILNPTVTSSGSAVAYLFDTKNSLTNGDQIVTIANAGTSVLSIMPAGNLMIGPNALSEYGPTYYGQSLTSYRVVSLGDPNFNEITLYVEDEPAGNIASLIDLSSATNQAYFAVESYTASSDLAFAMQTDSATANNNYFFYRSGATNLMKFMPMVGTGSATAYLFDTANVLTNGDSLVTFKNAGVQVANLTPSGSLTLSGKTNQLADSGSALTYNGVAIATTITNSFGVHLDGGGLVLATGLAGYSTIVNGGTIRSCVMLADQTGSAVVDIWRCTYGQFDAGSTHPVAGDKITASAPPTITSAVKSTNALTGWSLTVTNGDVIAWSVTACTNITKLDISVTTTR